MSDAGKRLIKAATEAETTAIESSNRLYAIIERLTRERDHLAQALTEANRAIEKIAKERDEARFSASEADDAGRSVMSVVVKQIEETKNARNQRDEARAAALREAASVRGWWLGVDGHGEPDGTYCSVKPSDDPNARLYVNAEAILALIDKQAPTNG